MSAPASSRSPVRYQASRHLRAGARPSLVASAYSATPNFSASSRSMISSSVKPSVTRTRSWSSIRVDQPAEAEVASGNDSGLVHPQDRQECFLGDLDGTHALHALLAFLLLHEELALARDVATVALGQHVLAHGPDGLARDDVRAADGPSTWRAPGSRSPRGHRRVHRRPARRPSRGSPGGSRSPRSPWMRSPAC